MKTLFEGIRKTKVRTALSAITVFITAVAICVVMSLPIGMLGGSNQMPQINKNFVAQQQTDEASADADSVESTDDASAEDSEQDDSDTADEAVQPDEFAENGGGHQGAMKKNAGTLYIIAAAIGGAGIILLVIINTVSTKKRKEEFAQMQLKGIPVNAIKKQLFTEAFAIILVFGIAGAGIGAAISRPVANAVMSSSQSQLQSFDGEQTDMGKMPENFDADDMPEMPDGEKMRGDSDEQSSEEENGDREGMPGDREFDEGNMPEKMTAPNGENADAALSGSVWLNLAVGIIAVLLMAAASGFSCALPIKKVEAAAIEEKSEDKYE